MFDHLPSIVVHIEKYLGQGREVIFDFLDKLSLDRFLTLVPNATDRDLNRTFSILIDEYRGKRLREGYHYEVNADSLNRSGLTPVHSRLLRLDSTSTERPNIFGACQNTYAQEELNDAFPPSRLPDLNSVSAVIHSALEVVIKDVKQGNWNEVLLNGKSILVYDAGCDFRIPSKEIRKIGATRFAEYPNEKPILVISHWDLDHYALLEEFTNYSDLFSQVFARISPPGTRSQNVFKNLVAAMGSRFHRVECENQTRFRPNPLTCMGYVYPGIRLFNGAFHRNKNISGFVCTAETETGVAILTADHHYDQINYHVTNTMNKKKEILVVPHHGGYAGPKIELPSIGLNKKAVISVGKNNYGHPKSFVKTAIKRSGYGKPFITLRDGDFRDIF